MTIDMRELYWAAGFLEGEGSFHADSRLRAIVITCGQVNREPLERLQKLIGGSIHVRKPVRKLFANAQPLSALVVSGTMAAAWAMTLYSLMSEKRKEQIRKALELWRDRPADPGTVIRYTGRCQNGHRFEGANIYTGPTGKRRCRECSLTHSRHRRARSKMQPPSEVIN